MKLVLNFVNITGLKKIGHDVKNKGLKKSLKKSNNKIFCPKLLLYKENYL